MGGRTVNGIRVKSGRKVKLTRRVVAEYVEQLQAALTLVRPAEIPLTTIFDLDEISEPTK